MPKNEIDFIDSARFGRKHKTNFFWHKRFPSPKGDFHQGNGLQKPKNSEKGAKWPKLHQFWKMRIFGCQKKITVAQKMFNNVSFSSHGHSQYHICNAAFCSRTAKNFSKFQKMSKNCDQRQIFQKFLSTTLQKLWFMGFIKIVIFEHYARKNALKNSNYWQISLKFLHKICKNDNTRRVQF